MNDTRVPILLPLPFPGPFDYAVPEGTFVEPGSVVRVPLGPRTALGVVWDEGDSENSVESSKLKPINQVLPSRPLPDFHRKFIDWVARYNLSAPGAVLRMSLTAPDGLFPPASERWVRLAQDQTPPKGYRATPARTKMLEALADAPERAMRRKALVEAAGTSTTVLDGLVKTGLIEPFERKPKGRWPVPKLRREGFSLNEKQQEAADQLTDMVAEGFSVSLIDGVTGSGKTEVYFDVIDRLLSNPNQSGQVLVMLPEIALTGQWLSRFKQRFGCAPALWHSDLTTKMRAETWRAVSEGEARVVVGARSALFLPFRELDLIVLDEEHDGSFKQDDGVIYQARDMAVVRAHIAECPIVLASATPSLETVLNTIEGRYKRMILPSRHGGAVMPDVSLINLREDKPERGSWLSPKLIEAVEQRLEAGQQTLLFLNRRGYAPLTLCNACGHRYKCPSCDSWLTEHRLAKRLMCHHCGYQTKSSNSCTVCGEEESLVACGPGVERVGEEAVRRFPHARIAIGSSDTMQRTSVREMIEAVERGEVDILVGTQILAKGYHFPNLTLVGVVDADLSLYGGDVRAGEKTFQLLHQVAGRAGRGEVSGEVMLQTHEPDHPVMQALISDDRDAFYETELAQREMMALPPYGRLAAIVISDPEEDRLDNFCRELVQRQPREPEDLEGIKVFGPAAAPISVIRGRHRRRFLVRGVPGVRLQPFISKWLRGLKTPGALRLSVDIDPYSFL